jgi:hypothetical protein
MSTVMKYLQKAHSYDISGELHEASSHFTIKNAVSLGLSNLTSKNLQNAMEVE